MNKSKSAVLVFGLIFSCSIFAQVQVDGYTRRDGTYVQPHYRSKPDSVRHNNYGAENNPMGNPYTGKTGTQRDEFSGYYNNQRGF